MIPRARHAPWAKSALVRGERPKGPIVAYDLETTPIPRHLPAGVTASVDPLYITAHGAAYRLSRALPHGLMSLGRILESEFFIPERARTRYVAWNANRFDARILFAAVAEYLPQFLIKPYVAKQGGLRGARVYLRANEKVWWDLLDAIAMTGLTGRRLDYFLERFAPDYRKLAGVIDFERETFNHRVPAHVAYAERDAEGLYVALIRADTILRDLTKRGLQVTIANAGIKYFTANIPEGVKIWCARSREEELKDYGMRGGYVFVARQHDGPAWTYDLNQAYAAAMRDARLPCGNAAGCDERDPSLVGFYRVTISRAERSPVPFYCRIKNDKGRIVPHDAYGDSCETMLLSAEIDCLERHGWNVTIHSGYEWRSSFDMAAMVGDLEYLRATCDGGPSGSIGLMVKQIGTNSFGKTCEGVSETRVVVSKELPGPNYLPFAPENEEMCYLWVTREEPSPKLYHRPQIGAVITAHVRCLLYDAIMQLPHAFIKADTDSLTFDQPVTHLELDPVRYGAWKVEAEGNRQIILGKKVYAVQEGATWKFVCKGLSVRKLRLEMYETWFSHGSPPIQDQVQLLAWKHQGVRYRQQSRSGTDFRAARSR